MNKAIYIATTEPNSGKSIISLGLMHLLLGKTAKVGYFRPIIDDNGDGVDNHIRTLITHFDLNLKFEEAYAYTRSELVRHKNLDLNTKLLKVVLILFLWKVPIFLEKVLLWNGASMCWSPKI
jgi:phosphate acetyltransferase